MLIDLRGTLALKQLRIELQESAELDFPDSCLSELLVLYDVCKYLELTIFQAREVLGAPGYACVTEHLNSPVIVDPVAVRQVLNQLPTS
ncbi:MAG: hypothetical protein AAF702_04990 [Chloroflexota bacterium]